MTHAIFLTAYNRPDLLAKTLDSWEKVRGLEDWAFVGRVEPSDVARDNRNVFKDFFDRTGIPFHEIVINPELYGVLHHPWVGFEELFKDFSFVVRAEDDLRVSDDILDYFTWAELTFRRTPEVATIHGYQERPGSTSEGGVEVLPKFNPLVWGTWDTVWAEVMRDTWDHDYSTFNGSPGHQAGWDWNLNTRIFPELGLKGVYPRMSRVDNIGVWGTHSHPGNWSTAETFRDAYGVHDYHVT